VAHTSGSPAFRGGRIEFDVDLRAYTISAVQKTAYRLAASCTAVLSDVTETSVLVALTFPGALSEMAALEQARLFHQELLDQALRERIARETAPLRDVILAHAYSRTSLPSDDD
jgi:His-Xaa-Ser system protein HxsD